MAAVDVVHRNNKPLPSPRMGASTRRAVPTPRSRKAFHDAAPVDDDDAASNADTNEPDAADPFTLVPHVAEQTLHAVHSAIFGQPWADLELVVSAGGKKEEVIYANSKVLKKACPALMRQIHMTGRADLDTMEQEQIAAAAAKEKISAETKRGVRPQPSRRSTNSLGLVDYRNQRGNNYTDTADEAEDGFGGKSHNDVEEEEEYADSVVEQPKHRDSHADEYHDDDSPQPDTDNFGEDDLDQDSPVNGKVAGASPSAPAPVQIEAPPTFSRSSSRFSKLMKFMNKDKVSPTAELDSVAAMPFSSVGKAASTAYLNETDTYGSRARVRRYNSGAKELSSAAAGTRSPTASRVQVTGCSAATLQALVFYLYTGHATFASRLPPPPSRRYRRNRRDSSSSADSLNSARSNSDAAHSEDDHDDNAALPVARVSKSPSFPPVFSATAAYCVGRQLGLRDLATKAFDHICLELSPKTVLADLLSPFVDRFDEVQRAHLEYVSENWDRVKRRPDFEHTVGRLVNGEYPKANKALLKLFSKLSVTGGRV